MALVAAIMKQFPDCDFTMAETLVKMHEQGKLSGYMGQLSNPPAVPIAQEKGTIHVAQNKSELPVIQPACQEATSAD